MDFEAPAFPLGPECNAGTKMVFEAPTEIDEGRIDRWRLFGGTYGLSRLLAKQGLGGAYTEAIANDFPGKMLDAGGVFLRKKGPCVAWTQVTIGQLPLDL